MLHRLLSRLSLLLPHFLLVKWLRRRRLWLPWRMPSPSLLPCGQCLIRSLTRVFLNVEASPSLNLHCFSEFKGIHGRDVSCPNFLTLRISLDVLSKTCRPDRDQSETTAPAMPTLRTLRSAISHMLERITHFYLSANSTRLCKSPL